MKKNNRQSSSSKQPSSNSNLTSIVIKLKYPSSTFELFSSGNCPYCLKALLSLEYKTLFYKDLTYQNTPLYPAALSKLREIRRKSREKSLPLLKINYKHNEEVNWVSGSTAIAKFLDSVYPCNSLFFEQSNHLNYQISILEDWLDESFNRPINSLIFLNENNFRKLSEVWQKGESNLFEKTKLSLMRREKLDYFSLRSSSKNEELQKAVQRIDEELLPVLSDRLNYVREQGYSFLTGVNFTIADITLYAFLKTILGLEEKELVLKRPAFQRFMEVVEALPLKIKKEGNQAKAADRSKMVFLETEKLKARSRPKLSQT